MKYMFKLVCYMASGVRFQPQLSSKQAKGQNLKGQVSSLIRKYAIISLYVCNDLEE